MALFMILSYHLFNLSWIKLKDPLAIYYHKSCKWQVFNLIFF